MNLMCPCYNKLQCIPEQPMSTILIQNKTNHNWSQYFHHHVTNCSDFWRWHTNLQCHHLLTITQCNCILVSQCILEEQNATCKPINYISEHKVQIKSNEPPETSNLVILIIMGSLQIPYSHLNSFQVCLLAHLIYLQLFALGIPIILCSFQFHGAFLIDFLCLSSGPFDLNTCLTL